MKIKVTPTITVEVKAIQTMVCPAGTAYWQVDYCIDGYCIHSATTGPINGNPDVIAMLDRSYTRSEPHYLDVKNPEPVPTGDAAKGRTIKQGSINGRSAWWEDFSVTHRQAIIEAASQIVTE